MASVKIPIIGPIMIALGEIDFINAHTTPARQISPFSCHRKCPPTSNATPTAERIVPVNGTWRLWRKLPTIISIEPHILPSNAAFAQIGLRLLYVRFIECNVESLLSIGANKPNLVSYRKG
jgi:hypothetical protein